MTTTDAGSSAANPAPLGAGFWRLWTSSSLSNAADGIVKVALPLVAVRITDSPALIAGLTIAFTLPWLFFALPAGALADRVDRRRAMVLANTARSAILLALAAVVALDADSMWLLYAVAFALGSAETLHDTSAQSILPQLVPRATLPRANSRLFAAEMTANEFVGPPLGGVLVAASAALAFAVPAMLWVFAVAVLLSVRGSFQVVRTGRSTMRSDIAEGLRYLWRNRLLRTFAIMVGLMNFTSNAVWAVFVLYAVGPDSALGLSEPGYGLLLTATSIGSVLGFLLAERIVRRLGRTAALVLTVVLVALSRGVPALTTSVGLVATAFVLGSVGIAVWNIVVVSFRQHVTPDRMLGRLNSGFRLVAWGTMPLGAAVGGLLAEAFGLRTVFATMGLIGLALVLGMRAVSDAAMTAAERAADAAASEEADDEA